MLPWLLLGGLGLYVLFGRGSGATASAGPTPPGPLFPPNPPLPVFPPAGYASGEQGYQLGPGGSQTPLGPGVGAPSDGSLGMGSMPTWDLPTNVSNAYSSGASVGASVGAALVPNGFQHGDPAAKTGYGVVFHTGCSCASTGAPVVYNDRGKVFLMHRSES